MKSNYRLVEFRKGFHRFRQSRIHILGLTIVIIAVVSAVFADFLAPYPEDVEELHVADRYQPPSWSHLFGTDRFGRDVLSRMLFGSRVTLYVVIYVMAIAVGIGTGVGLISGYVGGKSDILLMGMVDAIMSVPALLMALTICVVLPRSLENSMLAIAFTWWTRFARLVRGETIHVKNENYIEVARSFGAGRLRIMFKEILPNVATPTIVKMGLDAGWIILTQSALAFLGFGSTPPTPDLGTMMSYGRLGMPLYWWNITFPGLAIFLVVLGFCLVGDGLRDALGEQL
jgi:peptide/nickel transport system permease protein